MNITPTSARVSTKTIPTGVNFSNIELEEQQQQQHQQESNLLAELDRDVLGPTRVPIRLTEGVGYAGTFPTSRESSLWPGPKGGAFIWLSSSSAENSEASRYLRSSQKVHLHRLELKLEGGGEERDGPKAYYNTRKVDIKRQNPALGFLKTLFSSDTRAAMVHPLRTVTGIETQKRTEISVLPEYPFGAMGGRDARPIIWNNKTGKALEFDPKSLKQRAQEQDILGGGHAVSRDPLFDEATRSNLYLQRTDGIGTDKRFSQYRLLLLISGVPRLATFMAPRSLSLNLLASEDNWIICSAVFHDRRLFYLINRVEGRLQAVYQSSTSGIKHFVKLKKSADGKGLELVALMMDGSGRRYLFPRLAVETARFDGSAGLMRAFPICEFETISDGPFDQLLALSKGGSVFLARMGPALVLLDEKFELRESITMGAHMQLFDFSVFPMAASSDSSSGWLVTVFGVDPYEGSRLWFNLIDATDELSLMAKIPLERGGSDLSVSQPIYIPTRLSK